MAFNKGVLVLPYLISGFMMFSNQFLQPDKFDIQLLQEGTASVCKYCSISFKSRGTLFTSGATIRYLSGPNVETKTACPVCLAMLYRFTDTFSVQEELSTLLPPKTTAISLRDPDYQSFKSIVHGAYQAVSVIRNVDKSSGIIDKRRSKKIKLDDSIKGNIVRSEPQYLEWISALEKKLYPKADYSNAEEIATTKVHEKIGRSIRLGVLRGEITDLSQYAVYPTLDYIRFLCNNNVRVFDYESLSVAAGLLYQEDN